MPQELKIKIPDSLWKRLKILSGLVDDKFDMEALFIGQIEKVANEQLRIALNVEEIPGGKIAAAKHLEQDEESNFAGLGREKILDADLEEEDGFPLELSMNGGATPSRPAPPPKATPPKKKSSKPRKPRAKKEDVKVLGSQPGADAMDKELELLEQEEEAHPTPRAREGQSPEQLFAEQMATPAAPVPKAKPDAPLLKIANASLMPSEGKGGVPFPPGVGKNLKPIHSRATASPFTGGEVRPE